MSLLNAAFKKAALLGIVASAITLSSSLAYASDTVKVFTYNGERKESTVEVPVNPTRVAVIDYAALDIIDRLGEGSTVVATPQAAAPEYLKSYMSNKKLVNTGSVKEVDMEALMAAEPQVIFIGGRLAPKYNELSKIAPVVFLAVDYTKPLLDSVERSTNTVATIYSKKDHAESLLKSFHERLDKLKTEAKGKSVVVGMVNASQFKTLGDQGRGSVIGRDIGFNNLAKDITANHGNESSFELLLKLNPDYVFILDRDSAIGRKGAQLAKDVMSNDLVKKTNASKNGHIYYLNSAVWYLAEGGLTATDYMLKDVEQAFNKK